MKNNFQALPISQNIIKNWIFMESVVFLLFSSSIISMLGGTIQEPWIQNVGAFLSDLLKECLN
jgi:hypothetical protein